MEAATPHLEIVQGIESLWAQLTHAPSHLLLLLALLPFGILIKRSPIPNGFIPWVLIGVGAVVYPLFTSAKNISPEFENPKLILAIYGGLLGVGAMVLHRVLERLPLFKRFEKAIVQPFRTGDTGAIPRDLPKE